MFILFSSTTDRLGRESIIITHISSFTKDSGWLEIDRSSKHLCSAVWSSNRLVKHQLLVLFCCLFQVNATLIVTQPANKHHTVCYHRICNNHTVPHSQKMLLAECLRYTSSQNITTISARRWTRCCHSGICVRSFAFYFEGSTANSLNTHSGWSIVGTLIQSCETSIGLKTTTHTHTQEVVNFGHYQKFVLQMTSCVHWRFDHAGTWRSFVWTNFGAKREDMEEV